MKTKFTYSLSIISLFIIILISLTGFKNPDSLDKKIMASSGELNFTVRTVTAGGNYSPKHVFVVWIEDDNGFVKTRKLRGNARKQYLYTWKASTTAAGSPYNVVDAITGSTLTSHTTHTVSWDCLDLDGNIVPDGDYTVWVEFTDKHAQGPLYSLSFTKGPDAVNYTPSDETYFKDIELDFTPITAEFNSNTQEICQNEELTFTDESVNADEWNWDFGDGASPATANTPGPHNVSYTTAGLKTVSLTINESLTETKENYVEVFANPEAGFEFSGMDYTVDFTNTSMEANSYLWDFGDANTSTEQNPTHTYAGAGSYIVSLQAINAICNDDISYEVQVPMVGINEISAAEMIDINPNPNSGTFSVDISNLGDVSNYYILDMAGRKTAFNRVVSQSIISFDLENNQKGIYFLQLITDKKSYSKKFIIK